MGAKERATKLGIELKAELTKEPDFTTIQITKDVHQRLKIVAAISRKKLNDVIEDGVSLSETKYNIQYAAESNHE